LEFEAVEAQTLSIESELRVIEMLYQDKTLGRVSFGHRVTATLAHLLRKRRYADLDLLAMNRHLRRDLGID
jgi:hypothetical protein